MTEATREIMWNIPSSFKVTMYVLFALSLVAFFKGTWSKLQFVTGGKGLRGILGENGLVKNFQSLQWGNFFKTILFAGKVPRVKRVGFFHGLIYFGFLILWIATDLVAIHYDTPFKIFKGPLYIVCLLYTSDAADES